MRCPSTGICLMFSPVYTGVMGFWKIAQAKCPSHHVPLGPCSQHDSSPFALDHLAEVCLSGVTSEEFLFLSPPSHPVLSGERTHTCGPHLRSGVHRFDIPLSGSVFSPSLRGQYRHKLFGMLQRGWSFLPHLTFFNYLLISGST